MSRLYDALSTSFADPVFGMAVGLLGNQGFGQNLQTGLANAQSLQGQQFRQQAAIQEMLNRVEYLKIAQERNQMQRREFENQRDIAKRQQALTNAYIANLDPQQQLEAQVVGIDEYAKQQMQQKAADLAYGRDLHKMSIAEPTDIRDMQKRYDTNMASFQGIQQGMQVVSDMLQNPSPANDQAVLTYFLKTLLPDEAIMESDVGRASNLAGLAGRIESWQKQLTGEGTLPAEVRHDMFNTMATVYGRAQEFAQKREKFAKRQEREFNLSPGRITEASPVDTSYQPPVIENPRAEPFPGFFNLPPEEQEEALMLMNRTGTIQR